MTERISPIFNILHKLPVKLIRVFSSESVHPCSRFTEGLVLLFLTITIISLSYCRTKYNPDYISKNEFVTDGWVDENTIRISVSGEPQKNMGGIIQRKFSAKEAALNSARLQLTEKFKGKDYVLSIRADEYYAGINPEADEILSAIRKGRILKETYDDKQVCNIVYEITFPGLKKKIPGSTGR